MPPRVTLRGAWKTPSVNIGNIPLEGCQIPTLAMPKLGTDMIQRLLPSMGFSVTVILFLGEILPNCVEACVLIFTFQ